MWLYFASLLLSLAGLALLDWRYKLAFWYDRRRTAWTLGACVGIFLIWDLLGIGLGIFRHGDSPYALPFTLVPHFPIEELFFLVLLCYTTLLIYLGMKKWRRI